MAKKITLAEDRPDLVSEWHPTKNGALKPEDVTRSAPIKVWWLCSENHEWDAYINNRNKVGRKDGCPYCSGRYATPETSLAHLHPTIAKEWDYDKNKTVPELVTAGSNKKVWWVCSVDKRHKWDAIVASRTRENGTGCPYCNGKKAWEENNLLINNPLLASEWNYEKNKLKPEEVLPHSNKKYWWTCSECGEVWEQMLNNRQRYGSRGCSKCTSGQQTSFPEQSIFYYAQKIFPDLEILNNEPISFNGYDMTGDVYIPEKNLLIEYDGEYAHKKTAERDERKNKLCADMGIQLIRVVEPNVAVIADNTTLYILREQSSGFNSLKKALIQLFQVLINDLSFNTQLTNLDKIIDLENEFIEIEKTIKRVRKEKSILNTHPEICKEWDYEKNKGLKPEFFSHGSAKKVWWLCEKNHSYPMTITSRSRGRNCSYCAKRRLDVNDSLLTKYPDIASEWHPTKNNELTPKMVFSGTSQKVWWQCLKNPEHEWEATPNARTLDVRGTGCPGCSGQKVFPSNSLAVLNPTLASEWHPTKNEDLIPYHVTTGSDKRVWWKCSTCKHEWDAHIYHRSNGTGCPSPQCKNKRISEKKKAYYAKVGFEKLTKLATERNGEFVTGKFLGMKELHVWKCEQGHLFDLQPQKIKDKNQWCPHCS